MAKDDQTPADAPAQAPASRPAPGAESKITLDEWCRERSSGDQRVELIAAFHNDETASGRLVDTASAYAARFDELRKRPVGE